MGGAKPGRSAAWRATAALRPDETVEILRQLTAERSRGAEIDRLAQALLETVDVQAVADAVEQAVGGLDIESLGRRAGRHAWGYVEPSEAAWGVLDEAIAPFIEDIGRRRRLGLNEAALEVCKGVLVGLYRVDQGGRTDLLEYAPDFIAEAAGRAVDACGMRSRRGGSKVRRGKPGLSQESVERSSRRVERSSPSTRTSRAFRAFRLPAPLAVQ